jgi:hypothetical protein
MTHITAVPAKAAGPSLEDVLARYAEKANAAKILGDADTERFWLALGDELRAACPEYLLWLTEAEASRWAGKSANWLRSEHAGLVVRGLAAFGKTGKRIYRASSFVRRASLIAAREEGRQAGREAGRASA